MIERHSGKQHLVCECGVSQRRTYRMDEFDIMISDARADGWTISRIAGEWEHACPDCAHPAERKGSLL